MEQILLAYGIPKETVAAITILYRNTKVKVRSPDGDTEYFDIVAGVLQGDIYIYIFIYKPRVPWDAIAVREKRADVKTDFECNRKNPTNINALKLKKTQNELANIYMKEQTAYIHNQIDQIRDSVEDRQSRIAWRMVNEVSRWNSTAKNKMKTTNQRERIQLWKQYLLRNLPKVTQEPITRNASKQLDIKLEPFMQKELDW